MQAQEWAGFLAYVRDNQRGPFWQDIFSELIISSV